MSMFRLIHVAGDVGRWYWHLVAAEVDGAGTTGSLPTDPESATSTTTATR
jgi:hypothetical protein